MLGMYEKIFTNEMLDEIFPLSRADEFFEALFGDAEDGAYTIVLRFEKEEGSTLEFAFELHQRNNQCLACNLTYGLPQVFTRHPIINVKGIMAAFAEKLGKDVSLLDWRLLATQEVSSELHKIPFLVTLL